MLAYEKFNWSRLLEVFRKSTDRSRTNLCMDSGKSHSSRSGWDGDSEYKARTVSHNPIISWRMISLAATIVAYTRIGGYQH